MLWMLVIFQALILLGLTRALYQRELIGAANLRGSKTPSFQAVDLSGNSLDSSEFVGHLTALVFVSPSCPTCTVTLDELGALDAKTDGNVIVVCRGAEDECRRLAKSFAVGARVVSDEDSRLANLFAVSAMPTAVLINRENRIESHGEPKRGSDLADLFEKAQEAEAEVVA